ncbi:MAG: hypothetical protein ABSG17_15760 [Spirochaetia bacterium]|jgi:tetratricopeptide (TPR) repeat protein
MKKALMLVSVLALVAAASSFAQSYSVSYADGVAELKSSQGWSPLSIGDAVPANASVRISQSGSLELTRGKARITILKDGVYNIATLSRAADQVGSAKLGANISQKLQSLTTEKASSTAVGGVRATEQGGQAAVTWADENDEVRSEVASLLAEKKYEEALKALKKALAESPAAADEQEFTYLTGVAYYGESQPVRAYRALSKVNPDPSVQWYAKYVLLKAQVLVDSLDFSGAQGILKPFLSAYPSGESAQIAWLLTFYCQKGMGNAEAAKTALDSGYQLDPGSETAKLIDQQRKTP